MEILYKGTGYDKHISCMYLHRISPNHKGSSEDADLTLKRSEGISTKPIRPSFEKRNHKTKKWYRYKVLPCVMIIWILLFGNSFD